MDRMLGGLLLLLSSPLVLGGPQMQMGSLTRIVPEELKVSDSSSNGVWVHASPCPSLFEYRWWGNDVIGMVYVPPPARENLNDPIKVIVTLSLKAMLPNNYVGTLELFHDKEVVFSRLENNDPRPIWYRVRFPLRSPVPALTSIEVNGRIICQGPQVSSFSVMTVLNLDHTLYPGATGLSIPPSASINQQQPQQAQGMPWAQPVSRPSTTGVVDRPQVSWVNPSVSQPAASGVVEQPQVSWSNSPTVITNKPANTINNAKPVVAQVKPTTTSPPPVIQQMIQASPGVCGQVVTVSHLVQNGEGTERGAWPWLAAIFIKTRVGQDFQCGGSLVSDSHVVTAAHCIKDPNGSPIGADGITVYLGKYNLRRAEHNSQQRDVSRVILHPSYGGSGKYDNDVAVLFLESPCQITVFVRPVCLWPASEPGLDSVINDQGIVVGWGRDEQGNRVSDVPKMVKMPLVTQEECLRSHHNFYYLTTEKTFCAGGRDGSGPCNGDSGGGMFFSRPMPEGGRRWLLRGVVSLSLQDESTKLCDLTNYIVFTDVAKFTAWIKSVTGLI